MKPSPSEVLHLQRKHRAPQAMLWVAYPYVMLLCAAGLVQVWPALFLPLVLFMGTRLRQVSNLLHWASHNALCEDRRLNRLLGNVLAFSLFTTLDEYRQDHLSHHAHLGKLERDRDFVKLAPFGIAQPGPWTAHLAAVLSPRLWWAYRLPIGFGTRRKAAACLAHAVLLGICSLQGWWWAASAWLCAWLLSRVVVSYITDLLDHAGIYDAPSRIERSRNCIIENRPLRGLLFPAQDCYHQVHHEYPALGPLAQAAAHQAWWAADATYRAKNHHLIGWLRRSA